MKIEIFNVTSFTKQNMKVKELKAFLKQNTIVNFELSKAANKILCDEQ